MKIYIFLINLLTINLKSQYLFSVIISIYNTGRYLEEAIKSLINQTIGYSKIEIILVNDGSTDNTESICLKYKKLYENNIIYIKTSHNGVSFARNIGLKYAKGLYINFLDSDDKWDLKAFAYVNLFFNIYRNVDIVGCRMKYFDLWNRYHFLNYKFIRTRIVNLTEEFNCIQLSASSCFFRRSSIKENEFVKGIFSGEDIRFIANHLLLNPLLGILKEALYYYRKRTDLSSAIQNIEENEKFYLWTIQNVQLYIINQSIKIYNRILPFIQYFIAYELLFRIQSKAYKYLDSLAYNI